MYHYNTKILNTLDLKIKKDYSYICITGRSLFMESKKQSILTLLKNRTENYSNKVALGMKTQYGWKELTYSGVGLLSRKLACYLINEVKVEKGDRVAILSESKPEFGACVFASILAGTITVPLDVKLTKYELKSILSDCLPSVMLVSRKNIAMAKFLKQEISSIQTILVMDEPYYNIEETSIYQLPDNYDTKWRVRSSKSTAFIIYTSGTTGMPKGVETTFNNMLTQLDDLKYTFDKILPFKNINLLSILPMNHLFEMTVGFATFLNFGCSLFYTSSLKPKDILSIMKEKRVQFMIVVPAFLKLLKTTIEAELRSESKIEQMKFNLKFHVAKFVPSYRIKKFMFRKVHDKFGGKFMGCISGGAPLDVSVGEFFQRIGIRVFQGYGLSETSPVVSINVDRHSDIASVGKPIKSFLARTDSETGELLLKGPSVMKGYHNHPELTAEVIDKDGWFHTGDIAEIKNGGHIYITGRIKNMIVLSGGKKVFPEEVEAVLEKSPLFAEVCVFGLSRTFGTKDGTEEIATVVVPKQEIVDKYNDDELDKVIRAEVKQLSTHLTPYKRPVNIIVSKSPLPRTATNKVKRKEVKALAQV
jgi:long-chain acyl-CoA synthetase